MTVLPVLPHTHHSPVGGAAILALHGPECGDPLLQVGRGGLHLILPLLPLALVILELVLVRVSLKLLLPQAELPIPILVHRGKLLLLHLIMPQLHVQGHGLQGEGTHVKNTL